MNTVTLEALSTADFKRINRRISVRRMSGPIFTKSSSDEVDISNKVIIILERVKKILGILKPTKIKVHIVFHGSPLKVNGKTVKAFYKPRTKVIHVYGRKVNEYVLAHELCHVVLCQEFFEYLASNLQEILAEYCYKNLREE